MDIKLNLPTVTLLGSLLLTIGGAMYQLKEVSRDVEGIQGDLRKVREDVIILKSHTRSWVAEFTKGHRK